MTVVAAIACVVGKGLAEACCITVICPRPVQTSSDQTSPDQTSSDQTRPDQIWIVIKIQRNQTLPDQNRPVQTKPDQQITVQVKTSFVTRGRIRESGLLQGDELLGAILETS
ncbi:unnamed protein product [Cuscuta epithymum]|uniref:Uncharacterized protein n=1 Tax=Cuscuta epithymum TaxID=186058 RepID=A0AAV0ESQ9_9ASTE|nr:unnamed protein product [Cuscuta epithymum]